MSDVSVVDEAKRGLSIRPARKRGHVVVTVSNAVRAMDIRLSPDEAQRALLLLTQAIAAAAPSRIRPLWRESLTTFGPATSAAAFIGERDADAISDDACQSPWIVSQDE